MILTCPHCDTQFRLASDLLGEEGHQVKCSVCEETWFQTPSEDAQESDVFEEDNPPEINEELDIPDGVKPVEDEVYDNLQPAATLDREYYREKPEDEQAKLYGYAAAFAVFIVVLSLFIIMRGHVIKILPGSYSFYSVLGLSPSMPGEDLVFDRVTVKQEKDGMVHVQGHIINLGRKKRSVPLIEVELIEKDHKDVHIIRTDHDHIDAEGDMLFESEYPAMGRHYTDSDIKFILSGGGVTSQKAPEPKEKHDSSGHEEAHH